MNSYTKFLFFTGKGGVGKTSLASATAVKLADEGKKVLLISTDPASNLSDVLEMNVGERILKHPELEQLSAINIDPESAGEEYKNRAVSSLGMLATAEYKAKVREQLSGACTVEIASFDEFTRFISSEANPENYDHIVFDTAPTGHTLRLLELPEAWSSFLDHSEGASCIGPSSSLKTNHLRYKQVVETLKDKEQTTFILVARPEVTSLKEANRTSEELMELQLENQLLYINGVFEAVASTDAFANQLQEKANASIAQLPPTLQKLAHFTFPLLSYNVLGLEKLRSVFSVEKRASIATNSSNTITTTDLENHHLEELINDLEKDGKGLIMTMGKGGVGKTVSASAIALMLAERGHKVLLTTTDPAAHLTDFTSQIDKLPDTLTVERIDPKVETEAYIEKVMLQKGEGKTEEQKKLIREDLNSPCTEEVAVFHAFSKAIMGAKRQYVVMDTAPTGHTLLLLDTTGAYHNEVVKHSNIDVSKLSTPYKMIQNKSLTKVILVTLPETTPIREAQSLQSDLERAGITPYAWIMNQELMTNNTITDPILLQRKESQYTLFSNFKTTEDKPIYTIPYILNEKVLAELHQNQSVVK
ncbi:arsenical pump-driving ATPase [Flammeovirga agarivorans]|uniref:arsenite-transporting ATPase n=1 Tax=Flammeovirga agarivorans TaxID=2726742 RepID=A0A7X8XWE4_9BACT|nr:arsenical pump-driving ATPase [Flammeovirga agarivorans]NLR92015.1 arsenical pump-driving ATPase [Flammeovirga agarivorans]